MPKNPPSPVFVSVVMQHWPARYPYTWPGSFTAVRAAVGTPKVHAEVLILFPGSGNASRGQGPHERHSVAEPEQSSAEAGLRQAWGQVHRSTAHIKKGST